MIDLKEKRREARMTQVELAKAVGVVPQHISNIELGLFNPSVKVANLFCKSIILQSSSNWYPLILVLYPSEPVLR